MSTRTRQRPPEYNLKSAAVLSCVGSGKHLLSDVANATALAQTTVIRIAAQLVEDQILDARVVGDDIELSIRKQSVTEF